MGGKRKSTLLISILFFSTFNVFLTPVTASKYAKYVTNYEIDHAAALTTLLIGEVTQGAVSYGCCALTNAGPQATVNGPRCTMDSTKSIIAFTIIGGLLQTEYHLKNAELEKIGQGDQSGGGDETGQEGAESEYTKEGIYCGFDMVRNGQGYEFLVDADGKALGYEASAAAGYEGAMIIKGNSVPYAGALGAVTEIQQGLADDMKTDSSDPDGEEWSPCSIIDNQELESITFSWGGASWGGAAQLFQQELTSGEVPPLIAPAMDWQDTLNANGVINYISEFGDVIPAISFMRLTGTVVNLIMGLWGSSLQDVLFTPLATTVCGGDNPDCLGGRLTNILSGQPGREFQHITAGVSYVFAGVAGSLVSWRLALKASIRRNYEIKHLARKIAEQTRQTSRLYDDLIETARRHGELQDMGKLARQGGGDPDKIRAYLSSQDELDALRADYDDFSTFRKDLIDEIGFYDKQSFDLEVEAEKNRIELERSNAEIATLGGEIDELDTKIKGLDSQIEAAEAAEDTRKLNALNSQKSKIQADLSKKQIERRKRIADNQKIQSDIEKLEAKKAEVELDRTRELGGRQFQGLDEDIAEMRGEIAQKEAAHAKLKADVETSILDSQAQINAKRNIITPPDQKALDKFRAQETYTPPTKGLCDNCKVVQFTDAEGNTRYAMYTRDVVADEPRTNFEREYGWNSETESFYETRSSVADENQRKLLGQAEGDIDYKKEPISTYSKTLYIDPETGNLRPYPFEKSAATRVPTAEPVNTYRTGYAQLSPNPAEAELGWRKVDIYEFRTGPDMGDFYLDYVDRDGTMHFTDFNDPERKITRKPGVDTADDFGEFESSRRKAYVSPDGSGKRIFTEASGSEVKLKDAKPLNGIEVQADGAQRVQVFDIEGEKCYLDYTDAYGNKYFKGIDDPETSIRISREDADLKYKDAKSSETVIVDKNGKAIDETLAKSDEVELIKARPRTTGEPIHVFQVFDEKGAVKYLDAPNNKVPLLAVEGKDGKMVSYWDGNPIDEKLMVSDETYMSSTSSRGDAGKVDPDAFERDTKGRLTPEAQTKLSQSGIDIAPEGSDPYRLKGADGLKGTEALNLREVLDKEYLSTGKKIEAASEQIDALRRSSPMPSAKYADYTFERKYGKNTWGKIKDKGAALEFKNAQADRSAALKQADEAAELGDSEMLKDSLEKARDAQERGTRALDEIPDQAKKANEHPRWAKTGDTLRSFGQKLNPKGWGMTKDQKWLKDNDVYTKEDIASSKLGKNADDTAQAIKILDEVGDVPSGWTRVKNVGTKLKKAIGGMFFGLCPNIGGIASLGAMLVTHYIWRLGAYDKSDDNFLGTDVFSDIGQASEDVICATNNEEPYSSVWYTPDGKEKLITVTTPVTFADTGVPVKNRDDHKDSDKFRKEQRRDADCIEENHCIDIYSSCKTVCFAEHEDTLNECLFNCEEDYEDCEQKCEFEDYEVLDPDWKKAKMYNTDLSESWNENTDIFSKYYGKATLLGPDLSPDDVGLFVVDYVPSSSLTVAEYAKALGLDLGESFELPEVSGVNIETEVDPEEDMGGTRWFACHTNGYAFHRDNYVETDSGFTGVWNVYRLGAVPPLPLGSVVGDGQFLCVESTQFGLGPQQGAMGFKWESACNLTACDEDDDWPNLERTINFKKEGVKSMILEDLCTGDDTEEEVSLEDTVWNVVVYSNPLLAALAGISALEQVPTYSVSVPDGELSSNTYSALSWSDRWSSENGKYEDNGYKGWEWTVCDEDSLGEVRRNTEGVPEWVCVAFKDGKTLKKIDLAAGEQEENTDFLWVDCISEKEYGDPVGGAVDRLHYDAKPFMVTDDTQKNNAYGSALPGTVLKFGVSDSENKEMACVATRYKSKDELAVGGWKSGAPLAGLYFDAEIPDTTALCNMNGDTISTTFEGDEVNIEGSVIDLTSFIPIRVGECAAFADTTYRYNFTITNDLLNFYEIEKFVFDMSDDYIHWTLKDVVTEKEWHEGSGAIELTNSTYELVVEPFVYPDYAPASLYSFSIGETQELEASETKFSNDYAFASGNPFDDPSIAGTSCEAYCDRKVSECNDACDYEYSQVLSCKNDCPAKCAEAEDVTACVEDCEQNCFEQSASYGPLYGVITGEQMSTSEATDSCKKEYCEAFSSTCLDSCSGGSALYFCDSTARSTDLAWKVLGLTRYNSLGVNPETKTYDHFGESAYSFGALAAGDFLMKEGSPDCLEDPENCNYCTKSTGEWRSAPLGSNPGHTYTFDQYIHQPTFIPRVSFKRPELMEKDIINMDQIEYNRREFSSSNAQEAGGDITVPPGQ